MLISFIALGLTLVLIIAGIVIAASLQPENFEVSRSMTTSASAQSVFAVMSDLGRWREWSPWDKLDPAMKTQYEGEPGKVGSVYSWDGNNKVGAGQITITQSQLNHHITLRLEFYRPWKGTNKVTWSIEEKDGQRCVTWAMEGKCDALGAKIVSLLIGMDKMVGTSFTEGLSKLKEIVERA